MAKDPAVATAATIGNAPKTETATATAAKPRFSFDKGLELPAVRRAIGAGVSSETRDKFLAMEVGDSFLQEIEVPASITDAAEREKAFAEGARKATNSLSGVGRRIAKAPGNEGYAYAVRSVNDEKLGKGVRVWRVAAA